jgi:hypothetical protein
MRFRLVTAAILFAAPALSQSENVAGNTGLQNALSHAPKSLLTNPGRFRFYRQQVISGNKPFGVSEACAVPLVEVPVSKDLDLGIVGPNPGSAVDGRIRVPPPIPACPKAR